MTRTTSRHRLRAGALAAALVVAAAPAWVQAQPDAQAEADGRRTLAETIEAHGGLARFRSYGTMTYHTDRLPYSAAAPLDFDHTADLVARRHRMEGRSPKGEFVAGANDTQGWTTNLEALGQDPRWVNHGNNYFVLMPFVFADPGARVRSVGQRVFGGRAYDAVAVGYDRGVGDTSDDDYILYIDRDTRQLRLIDFAVTYKPMRGDTPIDRVPRLSLEFVEWQEVDGLLIPKTLHFAPWERTASGGRRTGDGVVYTVSDADFDEARPDPARFDPPEGAAIE